MHKRVKRLSLNSPDSTITLSFSLSTRTHMHLQLSFITTTTTILSLYLGWLINFTFLLQIDTLKKMALQFSSCRPKSTFFSSLLLLLLLSPSVAELSFNFYAGSCPGAELIVRNTIRSASSSDPSVLGKLLRLIFHDCFVKVHYILPRLSLSCITRHLQWNEIFCCHCCLRVVMAQCWFEETVQSEATPGMRL